MIFGKQMWKWVTGQRLRQTRKAEVIMKGNHRKPCQGSTQNKQNLCVSTDMFAYKEKAGCSSIMGVL